MFAVRGQAEELGLLLLPILTLIQSTRQRTRGAAPKPVTAPACLKPSPAHALVQPRLDGTRPHPGRDVSQAVACIGRDDDTVDPGDAIIVPADRRRSHATNGTVRMLSSVERTIIAETRSASASYGSASM
jgi:hypothetical protein